MSEQRSCYATRMPSVDIESVAVQGSCYAMLGVNITIVPGPGSCYAMPGIDVSNSVRCYQARRRAGHAGTQDHHRIASA
eukprot:3535644-Rhodomonas_salina.1